MKIAPISRHAASKTLKPILLLPFPSQFPIQQSHIPHIRRSSTHSVLPSGTFSMLLSRRFSSALARSPFLARCPLPPRAVPAAPPASRALPRRLMSSSSSGWHQSSRSSPPPPPPPPSFSDKDQLFRGLEAALGTTFTSEPLVPPQEPIILVISGPSGVGKDAVIKRLQQEREEIHFVVTATSRAIRPGEVDGKDYHFVTKEDFLTMIEREELLEYALVYGEYKGIPKQQIRDYMAKGHDIVLRVDIQGAATLRHILGESATFIFLVAESEQALVKRLIHRKTETPDMLLVRIATAREEVRRMNQFDYVVVNAEGKLEDAVKQVESIIDAEKAKVHRRSVNI